MGMGGLVRIAWPLQVLAVQSAQAVLDVNDRSMKLAYVVLEIVESHTVVAWIALIDDPSVPIGNCPRRHQSTWLLCPWPTTAVVAAWSASGSAFSFADAMRVS